MTTNIKHLREILHGLGYRCEFDKPPHSPRLLQPQDTQEYTTGELLGPTPRQQRLRRREANKQWAIKNKETLIRLQELDQMCWRYGLMKSELIRYLIDCLQSGLPEATRNRIQTVARQALAKRLPPKALPLATPTFKLTHLVSQKAWRWAAQLAEQKGRIVTQEQHREWQHTQRMERLLRQNRVRVRNPLNGGNLEQYYEEAAERRKMLDKQLEKYGFGSTPQDTGVLPYRILP